MKNRFLDVCPGRGFFISAPRTSFQTVIPRKRPERVFFATRLAFDLEFKEFTTINSEIPLWCIEIWRFHTSAYNQNMKLFHASQFRFDTIERRQVIYVDAEVFAF